MSYSGSELANDVAYSCKELAEMGLPGFPATRQGWDALAKKKGWVPIREVVSAGKDGRTRLYQPPPAVQALIDARLRPTLADAIGRPPPGLEKSLAELIKPHEYRAREQMEPTYAAPDFALLETLIRFAEGRLTRNITPTLLDKVDQMVEVWSPVAATRLDLAARLARIKASADLLRLE